MVQIEKLEVPVEAKALHLSASVKSASYYTNVYIKTITIYTYDQYPSGTPVEPFVLNPTVKSIDKWYQPSDLLISNFDTMFIVKIETTGSPSADTPCGLDNSTVIGATFRPCEYYKNVLAQAKSIGDQCSVPKELIDLMLQYEAFRTAVSTGNITTAIEFYKKFFAKDTSRRAPYSCGCRRDG